MMYFINVFLQECFTDNHPDVEELKKQRIRVFTFISTLSEQCLGSRVYSLKTYLIIDNATITDAGTYIIEITFGSINPITVQQEINVVVGGMC